MLPLSRNTTYTAAAPVKSVDLNDLEDSIIGAMHGLITVPCSIFGALNIGVAAAPVSFTHSIVADIAADAIATAEPLAVAIPLPRLPNGTRIVNVRVYLKDVASQPVVGVSLRGGNRANSSGADAVTQNSAASGATQTITLANVDHDVGASALGAPYVYLSTLTNATGTYSIYAVEIDIQKTA